MTIASTEPSTPAPFWHAALFHDGDAELVDVAVPYVCEGLEAGDAPAVALPPTQLEQVRDALGAQAAHVLFVDISVLGRNPARVLPEIGLFLCAQEPRRRVRAFGSPVWPGRSEGELTACHEHDALMNVALADVPVSVLCPFDRTTLDPQVLDRARTTHPLLCEDGRWLPSPRYTDPETAVSAGHRPLSDPGENGETVVFQAPSGPRAVRRAVTEHALRHGLDTEQTADLVRAAHEVATNTVLHTGSTGVLSLWADDTAVVCQIEDSGWIRDPLAGRLPPDPGDGQGYGLFLVNQLCDLVEIRTDPMEGTTVRMRIHRRAR